jgi:phenylacetate-CoA ligase
MRAEIEARFNIDAIDLYGLSEVMGPGVAAECIESKDGPGDLGGPFLPGDHRSRQRRRARDGERGELVFTSLTKRRCRSSAIARATSPRCCRPTARSMRRMAKVTGRTDDMLIIRGVNLFPSQIEELIVRQAHLSPHYVLEVRRDGTLDHLTVRVEPDPRVADAPAIREQAARDLGSRSRPTSA